jgi:uncharacterized membrane protein
MATNMNHFLAFQLHGNADDSGILGILETFLIFLNELLGKSAGDIFSAVVPGITAMDNIHPLLVHFPIAFLTSFVVLDFVASLAKKPQWREFAAGLLYFGTVMALFTVMAGFVAAGSVAHGENVHAIMERHEAFGVTVLCLATLLSGWRLKQGSQMKHEMNILYLLLSAILGLCLVLGADLGGFMVYHYGVAVKAVPVSVTGSYSPHEHHQ